MRGPVVYCAEEADNGDLSGLFFKREGNLSGDVDLIYAQGYRCTKKENGLYGCEPPQFKDTAICLVPYYRWGNRGKGGMCVFMKER